MASESGILLAGALLVVTGCSGEDSPESPEAAARNVVLITLDTTRADALGCYNDAITSTPNLDRIASEGTLFELCIATASVTPVSHASILTGLDPYRHGLRVIHAGSGYELSADVPTLATVLRGEGWNTAAILSSYTVSERFGLQHGFAHFDDGVGDESGEAMQVGADGHASWNLRKYQRRSDDTTDRVLAWLETAQEPFFLWIHYWDPHDLLLRPPAEVLDPFLRTDGDLAADPTRKAYEAEVHFVDRQVGRVVDALRESDLLEDTALAIIADHGEGLGDHDWRGHRLLYQEQIHLPLILRSKGVEPGRRVEDLVRSTDLVPTLLDLVGVDSRPGLDGRSLLLLIDGEQEAARVAYADQLNSFDTNGKVAELRPEDDLLYCVMDRRWKLIHKPTQEANSELYDLESDPGETNNLYAADHPQARRLMADLLQRGAFVEAPFPEVSDGLGDEAERALDALGYLDGEEKP